MNDINNTNNPLAHTRPFEPESEKESLLQLSLVAKAIYLILYENNCLSNEKVQKLFEEYTSDISQNFSKSGISVVCESCLRQIIFKPNQNNRCFYCGKDVTLNNSFDSSDLFSFDYMQIASSEADFSKPLSSNTMPLLDRHLQRTTPMNRRYSAAGITSRAISSLICTDDKGVTKDSAAMEYEIKMNQAESIQRMINQLISALKSMWVTLSNDDTQMSDNLKKKYLHLFEEKENIACAPVSCPYCNADNAPFHLISIDCSQCGNSFCVPLTRGFTTAFYDAENDKYITRTRLLEKIFTLLEAILIQSHSFSPEISYSSVSTKTHQLFEEKKIKDKNENTCPSCTRPVKSTGAKSKCIYCSSPLMSTEPGYFFDIII